MAIIGRNNVVDAGECTFSNRIDTTSNPKMSDQRTRTAEAGETITEIGIRGGVLNSTCTVRYTIYDISSGINTGTPAYETTFIGAPFTANTWYTKTVSWPLTSGNEYAVVLANVSGGTFWTRTTVWTSGIASIDATVTGADASPDPWTDTSSNYDYAGYASTEISVSDPTITFSDANSNSDLVSIAGAAFTGTVNVSVFAGATLAALGSTPDFEGSMSISSGEGILTMTGSALTTGADVHVRIGQTGNAKQSAYFTTVD